jgi:hypothetical protein
MTTRSTAPIIAYERRKLLQSSGAMLCAAAIPGIATEAHANAIPISATGESVMTMSLQDISDRLEIENLMVRYCYAIDDRDWDAYRSVFTADAIIDDTVTGGVRSGVEEHISYLKRALTKILISQHAISTILINASGDSATGRSHCSCPMVVDVGEGRKHVFFQGLWYRDALVRTAQGWKFSARTEEGYWTHNLPEGFKF